MAEKALSKALSRRNILCEDREIVLKPEQETAVSESLHGRDVMAVLPTGFGKSMIFDYVHENLHHCYFAFENDDDQIIFRNVVAELGSNGIVI